MGSTFSSLNAGLTGLYAAQRLIEVSGQNINNQNTPGYTRQRVEQKALGIGSEPSVFAGSVPQGGGVEITGVRRLGDFFLDTKLRLETGRAAGTKQIDSSWSAIESAMDELGTMSVSNSLRDFYKAWGDVNNSSDNRGARATAIGNAEALVNQIATGYTHISDQWKNGRQQLDALVTDLNTAMDSVAALNDRIRKGTAIGANVNHLIDERDQLALHISELTGATVKEGYGVYTKDNAPSQAAIGTAYSDGTIEIMLAGNTMVGKDFANHFKAIGSVDMPGIDAAPRDIYQKAVDALGGNGKLTQTFIQHGIETQQYQAQVRVYEAGDSGPDGKTIDSRSKYFGQKYVAFYDMEKINDGQSVNDARMAGTEQIFGIGDFQHDEGPVRITWQYGGHQVVIEEGSIGGLMNNLRPAQRPGVSATLGNGGSWAEAGKLYNDLATNIATEVNNIHASSVTNKTKTLVTTQAAFQLLDPTTGKTEPAKMDGLGLNYPDGTAITGDTIQRNQFATDELFDAAVKDAQNKLEANNFGKSAIYTSVKEDGGDFFKFAAADNKLPAALRLQVAFKDPQKIAAGVEVSGIYDGSVALRIANQQDSPTSALNEWSKSVVDIGVHAKSAADNAQLAEQTRGIAEQQQKAQASVDMNEEVVNLIQGQHAYAGAARIMSTVNSMLETLINLGR